MKDDPICPEDVLEQARRAWQRAERHEADDEIAVADQRPARDRLRKFVTTVENAYQRVPEEYRGLLEWEIEYSGHLPDWRSALHNAVNDFADNIERRSGPKNRPIWVPEVSLTGLRAFAIVIEEHWTEKLGRKWRYSGYDQPVSPAERFLLSAAQRIEPRVTDKMVRTIMKHP